MLVEEVWEKISSLIDEEIIVEDFVVGAKYSYVIVKGKMGKAMGTAYMPSEDITRGYSRVPTLDNLKSMLTSTNILEKSLSVAFLNALSQYLLWNLNKVREFDISYGNITDFVSRKKCKKTIIIGNMMPLVKILIKSGVEPVVFERNPRMRNNALPDCFESRFLPEAECVIISGATLVNDTIDFILSQLKKAIRVILVGPTAAIFPIKSIKNITHIASLKIENVGKVAKIIRLGGGRWDFSQYAKEYVITNF